MRKNQQGDPVKFNLLVGTLDFDVVDLKHYFFFFKKKNEKDLKH